MAVPSTDFTTAIDLNPDNAIFYIHRGLAYHHKGDYDLAIVDLTKAVDLNPNDANVYNHRGAVYCDNGDY